MGVCPLFNGGTLKNLTMQVISGCMYKSMYIGHNVQEKKKKKKILKVSTTFYRPPLPRGKLGKLCLEVLCMSSILTCEFQFLSTHYTFISPYYTLILLCYAISAHSCVIVCSHCTIFCTMQSYNCVVLVQACHTNTNSILSNILNFS